MKTFSTPMCFTVLCSKSVVFNCQSVLGKIGNIVLREKKEFKQYRRISNTIRKSKKGKPFRISLCGERGIRTPETLLTFTRFPGVPLQPLEHLSIADKQSNVDTVKGYAHVLCSNSYANLRCFF